MASTVTAATLTVTVSESITLNGQDMTAVNSKSIASIKPNRLDPPITYLNNLRFLFRLQYSIVPSEFVI